MPIETLDRTPPPFFKQGPPALSRLVFFSALALFLMALLAMVLAAVIPYLYFRRKGWL